MTIELGNLTDEPVLPAPRRPFDRRRLRPLAAALVAVLTLLALTGSVAPRPPAVSQLYSITFSAVHDMVAFDDQTLYLGRNSGQSGTLEAYDLATGRQRWSSAVDSTVGHFSPPSGGVLLVPVGAAGNRITARDAATGRPLWSAAGTEQAGTARTVLLFDPAGRPRLRLVDRRDGHTRWARKAPDVESWGLDGDRAADPTEIVLAAATGAVTVLGYADGQVRRTGRLDGAPIGSVLPSISVFGNQLIITRVSAEGPDATVYRRDTFQKLWQADGSAGDCGPVVCLTVESTVLGRDAATGKIRWRRDGIANAHPMSDNRVLAQAEGADGPQQLLDSVSGKPIGRAVDGEVTTAPRLGPDRPMLVVGPPTGALGQDPLIAVDPHTGAARLLGSVDETVRLGCLSSLDHLLCWRSSQLVVYRVRTSD